MYQIDKAQNRINRLEEKTFIELGFKEREHLQEWISKVPDCLGEELQTLLQKRDKMCLVKVGMMQEVLTGMVRLV